MIPRILCNCDTCTAPTDPQETTVTNTPAPEIQYGLKTDGVIAWPDEDDELHFRGFGYVDATDLAALRRAVGRSETTGLSLVRRELSYGPVEDVKPPLPTTPGSVVRATVRSGRTVFVHNDNSTEFPWTGRTPQSGKNDSWHADALSDVEIIFDAGAAA